MRGSGGGGMEEGGWGKGCGGGRGYGGGIWSRIKYENFKDETC